MRGTEFLEKLDCVDTSFLEEAESIQPQRKNRQSRFLKWGAVAACFLALLAIAPIAAEAKEYNDALKFLASNGVSSEGMSRAEIKEAYRNWHIEAERVPTESANTPPVNQEPTDLATAKAGDRVIFGSYEQNSHPEDGAEPIEWYVLERRGDFLLLLSRYILDVIPYDNDNGYHADTRSYALDWEGCSLRAWLNHDFYETAFNDREKSCIALSTLENPDNPDYATSGGNPTEDYVFLLSLDEAKQYFSLKPYQNDTVYGNTWWDFEQDRRIRAHMTNQAYQNRKNDSLLFWEYPKYLINGNSEVAPELPPFGVWWLRSPGANEIFRLYVGGGRIGTNGIILTNEYGIRPALWLNLSGDPEKPLPTAPPVSPTPTMAPAEPVRADLPKAQTGNLVTFGSYEQDGNAENGTEAIEWYVLDRQGDRLLLLSKDILDCGQYSEGYMFVPWENCTLRQWLNKKFYNTAFNDTEKTYIELSTLENPDNPVYQSTGGNPTKDRVFLLSLEEMKQYFSFQKSQNYFGIYTGDTRLRAAGTKQAYQNGLLLFHEETNQTYLYRQDETREYPPDSTGTWWLRSPGYPHSPTDERMSCAAQVDSSGCITPAGNLVYATAGIRPAIWINLDTSKVILPTPTPVLTERKVVDLVDKTGWGGVMVDTAFELFYSDDLYDYYFSCIKSQYVIVRYTDETEESVKTALASGAITIDDLDKYGIHYEKQEKGATVKPLIR